MTTETVLGRPATKKQQELYLWRMARYHEDMCELKKYHADLIGGETGKGLFCSAETDFTAQRRFERLLKELEQG